MSERITFRIERDVTLDPLWFDREWYDTMRSDGLSHEDALTSMVEEGMREDWTSLIWEAFGPGPELASGFAQSITRIDLVTTA